MVCCAVLDRCDYCEAACSGGGAIDVDVSNERPIPVLDGFGFGLVSTTEVLLVLTTAVTSSTAHNE